MIVDSLTHVTPDGRWFDTAYDASEDRLLREMDEAGVDRAVVVALADFIENDFVAQVCRRHGDRLIPGASINPARYRSASDAARAARAHLADGPYPVLKLHPRLNRYDPLDPRCLAVLEEIASWQSQPSVWMDSFFHFRGGTLRKGVVETIHELVNRFPTITFLFLHGTGTWLFQTAEAIRDCPNAYLDLSFVLRRYARTSLWDVARFLLMTFDRRLVYGSDFPEISVPTSLDVFSHLAEGVPEDKRDNVLGNTLVEILGT